jgi:hypothetical protein
MSGMTDKSNKPRKRNRNREKDRLGCREWKKRNAERVRLYAKAYREKNRERLRMRWKAYSEANRKRLRMVRKAYREKSREVVRLGQKAWYEANGPAYHKAWRDANRETVRLSCREWKKRNAERVGVYAKAYREANPEKRRVQKKEWMRTIMADSHLSARYKQHVRTYCRQKRQGNPAYRMAVALRNRLVVFIRKGVRKSERTEKLLGCSFKHFVTYIESKWESGMDWSNYGQGNGKWELDHIIPCALFDLNKPEHQKRCFHFSNLQPLWSEENRRKSAAHPYLPSFVRSGLRKSI